MPGCGRPPACTRTRRRTRGVRQRIAAEIADDTSASAALASGSAAEVESLAEDLARRHDLASLELTDATGSTASAGGRSSIAGASVNLVGPGARGSAGSPPRP